MSRIEDQLTHMGIKLLAPLMLSLVIR
jgi:hypothetical protein